MSSSLAVIGTLLLSSSILGSLPDNANSEGLSQGELFLAPLAGNYNNGFSISYLRNANKIVGDDDLLFLDLAKSFSTRRWYFRDNQILEVGGGMGAKQYFTTSNYLNGNNLLTVGSDYIVSNHIGYLKGNFVLRLSWNYESKQISQEFATYLEDPSNQAQAALTQGRETEISGDNLELLFADIRPRSRYYIGLGGYSTINLKDRPDKRFARVGFDYRGNRGPINLVFGGEVSYFGFNGGKMNYRATVGMEKSDTPLNGWRLLSVWEEGPSAYGPYHDTKVNHLGIKATRFF